MGAAFVILCFAFNFALSIADDVPIPEQCFQPAETGNCRARIPMWFYNSTSNKCEYFSYGGCPGNDNMFPTREECISVCDPGTCFEPAETGECRANVKLWFYNSRRNRCHKFTYGGCGGNENKFGTKHTCQVACGESNQVCPLSQNFQTVGWHNVHEDDMESEMFMYYCEERCRDWCVEDHTWGHCLAFSLDRRWYGCYCYLFNRYLSEVEFDYSTQGQSLNRYCEGM